MNNINQTINQPNNSGNIINFINSKLYIIINSNSKDEMHNLDLNELIQDAIKDGSVYIKYNDSTKDANNKNNEGVEFFIKGEYEKALECFNEAIKIDDSIAEIHYNLGNTKLFLHNKDVKNVNDLEKIFDDVRKDYAKAINLSINKPDFRYYYNRGTLYAFSKKYLIAIEDLSKSIEVDRHAEAYINRAISYLMLNDNLNAEEDLKKAEELSNVDDKYLTCILYNHLGNTYFLNKKIYEADNYYNKSLDINPSYIYAILGKANVLSSEYIKSKDNNFYIKALEQFKKAEEIDHNFDGIYYNKSHLILSKGRIEKNKELYMEAIKLVKRALECINNRKIEDNTTKALYYYGMGVAYSELYNYDKSVENKVIESYKKSIELNESDYNPYYNLANFYDKVGNRNEAINYYNKSIEINPKHESSYNNKAAILMEDGKYDEAIIDLLEVIKINKNNVGAYYNLGVIYSYQKKYQLAIDNFNRCINLSNDSYFQKISYYNLGIIVGITGNNEEAVRNLIRAYEINNNIIDNNIILKKIMDEAITYKNEIAINYLKNINKN